MPIRLTCVLALVVLVGCGGERPGATAPPAQSPTSVADDPSTLRIVSTEEAPYQFTRDGAVRGFAADLARELLREVGREGTPIEMLPWTRAYKIARTRPNTLIFTITRTSDREPLFHWTCPLIESRNVVYKLRSRADIEVTSLDDVKRYRLGLWRDDVRHQFFVARGFDEFELVSDDRLNVRKLLAGRIDLYVGNPLTLRYQMREVWGFTEADVQQLEAIYPLADSAAWTYLAFSLGSDAAMRAEFAAAMQRLRASPRYGEILARYGIDLQTEATEAK